MTTMYFRKMGQGPDLIILHGLFGSSDNWLTIARAFENNFTVYLPDFRNHGQSPHTGSHTYRDMVDDLDYFFKTHQIKNAGIIGHSMGGKTAMMFGALYPDKINNLIVADIAPKSYNAQDHDEEDSELILDLMLNLDFSKVASRKEIDAILAQTLQKTELRQFLIKNIHRDKEGRFSWKINVPVLKQYLPQITQQVNSEFFKNYKPLHSYPVSFIRGLKSGFIKTIDLPVIKDIYPESKIIDIPDAGHWLHAEKPEEFVKAVIAALTSSER